MAAMTRTSEGWEARALELAEAHRLTGTAHLLERGYLRWFYAVPSRGPGEYIVIEHRLTGRVTCTCISALRHRPCGHVGAALHLIRQREAATLHPDTDPLANWRHGFAW